MTTASDGPEQSPLPLKTSFLPKYSIEGNEFVVPLDNLQSKRNKASKNPLLMVKLTSQQTDCEQMVNPFYLKTAFLAKHAQHVVLIHFPIALFITAVAFDVVGQWTKGRGLAAAAYYNLLAAAISTLPVLVTGLLAWQFQLEGQKLKGILLLHVVLACVSTVMIWLVWWVHFRARRRSVYLPGYRLAVELVAVALVALTGHLGGFLSGVNLPSRG
jgi:uncharacterized membrane protein